MTTKQKRRQEEDWHRRMARETDPTGYAIMKMYQLFRWLRCPAMKGYVADRFKAYRTARYYASGGKMKPFRLMPE